MTVRIVLHIRNTCDRMTPMKTTVSQVLREAIEHAGQSRNEIARATGVSASAISRFVEGGRALRTPNVDALCAYLGLTLVKMKTTSKARKGKGGA